MKPLKRVLRHDGVQRVLCWLAAWYIRLVHATTRWTVVNDAVPRHFADCGQGFVVCFWHGRILMMARCWSPLPPGYMLASRHRDGQTITRVLGHFGMRVIAGSTGRGGAMAMRAMLKALAGNHFIAITPDGPRGPRMRVKEGAVALAQRAGVPIVPVSWGTSRRRLMATWDAFDLALPFARGAYVWGDPITVEPGAEALEPARRRVEQALNDLTAQADRLCGVTAPEPAPEPGPGPEPAP
ncbi:MAG: lysophospholipid acyltransferase family protein [Hyphomicrobiales bacterium]|nr:lysophospholipid acyltransferase family protein [Hyphomicrobiales bacterium]MCP5371116.1 lysophospholipid acyltransferase family protein [Hyphomicrobiales bacterium]